MSEQQSPTPEVGDDVVLSDDQTPEAEAAEVETEGQVEGQPAEEKAEAETPDAEAEETKTRNQKRKERRREYLERIEREKAEAIAAKEAAEARAAKMETRKAPKEDDFASIDEYQAALSAYLVAQELDNRDSTRHKEDREAADAKLKAAEQRRMQEAQENWAAQRAEGASKYSDFDAVVHNQSTPVTEEMRDHIISSDSAADLAYYIGKNPELAKALSHMSGLQLAKEMGRAEVLAASSQAKKLSTAPTPITPVTPSPTPSGGYRENMTADEYREWREKGGKA